METLTNRIKNLQTRPITVDKTNLRTNLFNVFHQTGSDINEYALFLSHFSVVPNFTTEYNINNQRAFNWFLDSYEKEIIDLHYTKRYFHESKNAKHDDFFCYLYDDLLIHFDTNQSKVTFLYRKTDLEKVDKIIEGVKKFKERKKRRVPQMSIIVQTRHGLGIERVDITKPKLKIEDNYNDDFESIHEIILKRLSKKNDKGLVLLHGEPGTGKTSYIRHLITSIKKDVIFLPPNMASAITSPELVPILLENKNSIFIIEDAENIIINREDNKNSPVSALLNISDGLLSDFLNIQLICSFNTDVSRIDDALLRKGRMIAKYDFKKLEPKKANALSKKLGFDKTYISPMSLTDIYNQSERSFGEKKERKVIGF